MGRSVFVLPFRSAIAFERSLVRLLASAWPSLSPPLFLFLFLSSPLVATLDAVLRSRLDDGPVLCAARACGYNKSSQVKSKSATR